MIVDHDAGSDAPLTLFESGAILLYHAKRSGMLLPTPFHDRMQVMRWPSRQVGGLGPFGGQCFRFGSIAPATAPDVDNAYSRGRYASILSELWTVLEKRLSDRSNLAGDFSIADVACYPWIRYPSPLEGETPIPP